MIRELWSTASPLAELFASTSEVSNAVNRWFRRSSSISESGIWIVIFMAIALLWVVLYFWDRSQRMRHKTRMDREGLFAQLCDLHQLSKVDRQLLRTVAKTQRVDQPALAFVDPYMLLKFAESAPGAQEEVRLLADRLFGQALVEEIVQQSSVNPATAPQAN